jgi:putative nucleotidyltransferase with HDIG domain
MITVQQAIALLRKHGLDESRIAHSQAVAELAFGLATGIHARNPSLDVNPEKVRVAALLHDIGRSIAGDHEVNSVDLLNIEGLADLAAIVMHGSLYEISVLRGKADPSLLPQSLENKIVAYADARCKDKVVSLQERFNEILSRRAMEREKVASVTLAMPRYFALERELLGLLR